MELNTRCSEGYRRYNSEVPKYLYNKPRLFLNHCRQRLTHAGDVQLQHIKIVDDGTQSGNFQVQSQSESKIWYNLSFGARDIMPKCSCPDFSQTGLPCKHFFAIFNHFPKCQWDSLPEKYRENPHLSLDRELVFADPNTHNSEVNEESIEYPEAPRDPQAQRAARPNPKAKENTESQLRQEAMACRETLKGLALMTYNVESINALKELNSSLTTLLNKQLMKRKTCPAMVRNIVVRLLGILTFHYLYVPRKRDLKTELENLHP